MGFRSIYNIRIYILDYIEQNMPEMYISTKTMVICSHFLMSVLFVLKIEQYSFTRLKFIYFFFCLRVCFLFIVCIISGWLFVYLFVCGLIFLWKSESSQSKPHHQMCVCVLFRKCGEKKERKENMSIHKL